jgi:hypothetical protein
MKVLHDYIRPFCTIFLLLCAMYLNTANAQVCGTGTPLGSNLICNGDFEKGDSCFFTNYNEHSMAADVACSSCYRNWSNPDEYQVVTNLTTQFHASFPNIADHTPTGTNHFMAVDGSCSTGKIVWSETVNITASTNYYFTSWVTSLFASNTAQLQFVINGAAQPTTLFAPATVGSWVSYTQNWFSGATSGPITISIINLTIAGCGNGNDFGIDDVSFTAGCAFLSNGPQPNLGPDLSLCGTGGSIVLSPNLGATTANRADVHYNWSTGVNGFGNNAAVRTITVSAPGTYSVCIDSAGSCIKSDIINITTGFTINLGPDVTLCNPPTALLDAGYGNGTTTYQWSKNGINISGATAKTYTATGPGTYRVTVTDASCSFSNFDDIIISTNAAVPNDVTFCPPAAANLSVTGTGTYEWYPTVAATGAPLATGASYSPSPAITTTYYVKDASNFSYTVGPTALYPGNGNDSYSANQAIVFNAAKAFTLNAATVFVDLYTPSAAFTIGVTLRDNTGAFITSTTVTLYAPPAPLPPNPNKIVVPIGFNVPIGSGYRLSAEGTSGGINLKWDQGAGGTVTWPFSVAGVISLTGLHPSYSWLTPSNGYGYFYNWDISAGANCGIVPVTATVNCPAPVELLNFRTNVYDGKNVLISWQTASELNADYYMLQRSTDGITFSSIGKVNAKGSTNTISSYSFSDVPAAGGMVYYRLVQYDFNGASHTSEIRSVNINNPKLSVYPNPTNGIFQVSFDGTLSDNIKIEVINNLGQDIYLETVDKSTGILNKQLDLRTSCPGIYYLKIQAGADQWIERIVKE